VCARIIEQNIKLYAYLWLLCNIENVLFNVFILLNDYLSAAARAHGPNSSCVCVSKRFFSLHNHITIIIIAYVHEQASTYRLRMKCYRMYTSNYCILQTVNCQITAFDVRAKRVFYNIACCVRSVKYEISQKQNNLT
jgi:hypothetical protein